MLETATRAEGRDTPGVIVLGADGSTESITPEAEEWLAQIPRDKGACFELPTVVHIAARQARAVAAGTATAQALSRIRLTSGRWLLVRAAQLRRGDGHAERTAVILEPAHAAELAPLIIELYELSPRERQVTEMLLRGLPIEEIAAELWISRHTVRDYTKAIFAKFGVGSRPELTAMLFHDHYLPTMDYAS
jgi:DNA-binding CsgD family transcriptional regulator